MGPEPGGDQHRASNRAASVKLWQWVLALALLLGLLVYVDYKIGWRALLGPWRDFPPSQLMWLVLLTALSYLTRALRVYDLYRDRQPAPFSAYLRISVLHITALNLVPLRAGELAFPLLMKRHLGERYRDSVVNLMWLRAADLWMLLWLGLLVMAAHRGGLLWLAAAVGIGAALLVHPLRARMLARIGDAPGRVAVFACLVLRGLPERFGRYLRLLLWTAMTWLLKLVAFVQVAGFFVDGGRWALVPGIVAAEISNSLPIQGVAGFGSYELALVLGSRWTAFDTASLVVAAVNLHLFILGCTLLFGALAALLPLGAAGHRRT